MFGLTVLKDRLDHVVRKPVGAQLADHFQQLFNQVPCGTTSTSTKLQQTAQDAARLGVLGSLYRVASQLPCNELAGSWRQVRDHLLDGEVAMGASGQLPHIALQLLYQFLRTAAGNQYLL
eukprot:Skav210756  [mRNA]  locus=scaffold1132:22749:23108:+ [translate_table: standard]